MAIALFISEQYIKDLSYVDENVDVKLLRSVIKEAQEIHIKTLLGTALYDQLITQVTNNTVGTGTISNKTLLDDYIQPALAYWTLFEGCDVLTFKIMNKSIVKRTSGENIPIETTDVVRLMGKFRDKAEWYSERLRLFLVENTETFTLYLNPGTGADTIHPKSNVYSGGIWLGGTKTSKSIIDRYENNDCGDY